MAWPAWAFGAWLLLVAGPWSSPAFPVFVVAGAFLVALTAVAAVTFTRFALRLRAFDRWQICLAASLLILAATGAWGPAGAFSGESASGAVRALQIADLCLTTLAMTLFIRTFVLLRRRPRPVAT